MLVKTLKLQNFRNIAKAVIEFDEKINIITGKNGQGKTSVLESLYYLALTKSFREKADKVVLQHNKEFFNIEGTFLSDRKEELTLRLYFSDIEGKHLFFNKKKVNRFSEMIGRLPVILLSLEDLSLTYGVPQYRRRFLDILLSQVNPLYLQALQYYKRNIMQRNQILSLISEGTEKIDALFPWDVQLIQYGSEIIFNRLQFVRFMNDHLQDNYRQISEEDEKIEVRYKTFLKNADDQITIDSIQEQYESKLSATYRDDIKRQNTLIGPHRDDLLFFKDGFLLKSYGSQGENKTFLIALKFVESAYLKKKNNEIPIFLLDDIFGELDTERIRHLLSYLIREGQTFVTTTLKEKFNTLHLKEENFIKIKNGRMVH